MDNLMILQNEYYIQNKLNKNYKKSKNSIDKYKLSIYNKNIPNRYDYQKIK